MIFLRDRFTAGLASGLLAGLASAPWNILSYHVLDFSKLRFMDFAATLIFGGHPDGIGENIFALLATLSWYGFLGILFAYLIKVIKNENLILKSVVYGVSVWFFSYAVTYLFKVSGLTKITLATSVSNFIGSILFGLALGYFLNLLNRKVDIKN